MVSDKIVYAETFELLGYMNAEVVKKIPLELLEFIDVHRDKNYISKIDPNHIFNPKNLHRETREFLAFLDLEYLSSGENKAKKLKIYEENEKVFIVNNDHIISRVFNKRNDT